MNNYKKSILLDVDEVICFSGYLQAVNEFLGTNYVIDDFNEYYVDNVAIPKDRFDEFNLFLKGRNMYENPVFIPGAVNAIERLSKYYDIYVCSACINPFDSDNSGQLFVDKYNFLVKYLPFLDPNNFIFTGAKHLFKADIQIDDRLCNLDNEVSVKILFPAYHNGDISEDVLKDKRVIKLGNSWHNAWDEIERYLCYEYININEKNIQF